MKIIRILLISLSAMLVFGCEEPKIHEVTPVNGCEESLYVNVRFNYSLCYPLNILTPLGESDNGDGNRFISFDGRTFMVIFAGYAYSALEIGTLKGEFDKVPDDVAYKRFKDNWYVVSKTNGDTIEYERYIEVDGVTLGFKVRYPASDKEYWDDYLNEFNSNIKFPLQN
ncbi:hypothetical protein VA249_07310 [Vibrio alfacsensis]|uniref:hypothetical protein n=1 Tax=Vibrio alfacsensis TaxID=1074311 RepID=UPI001BF14398|nr:hypothetical protein [Vibrio alfacsensis]BBM64085.1 hypothetical protein VA249_07310 [Vibrio alfacsensis]